MTEDTDIEVNPDWIVSFTNVEMLRNSYLEKMEDPEDETIVDNLRY